MKLIILFNFIFLAFGTFQIQQVFACSYSTQPTLQAEKNSCDSQAGKSWSCVSHRCLTSAVAADRKKKFDQCQKLPAAEQNSCVKNLAQSETGVNEGDRSTGGDSGGLASIAATAYSGLLFFGLGSEGDVPSCTSKSIFMGSSLAFLAFHYYTEMNAKSKFKELLKEYESEKNAYNKQVKAFKYLKKEQEMIAKIAAEHKKFYTLTALGYGAALAAALSETAPQFGMVSCATTSSKIPMLVSSPGIAVASGIGLGLTFSLRSAAAKQEKISKANALKIQTIIDGFASVMANSCPQGRDDYKKPDCFCMNTDGSQNGDRTKSTTCQKYWSELDKGYFAKSDPNGPKAASQMGCVTITQKFDPKCQCKKLKDKKTGKNACLKVSTTSLGGIPGISAFSPLVASKGLEMAASGNLPGATISGQNAGQLALKSRKAAAQLIKKFNQAAFANGLTPINLKAAKKNFLSSIGVRKNMATAKSSVLQGAGNFGKNQELKKALETLNKKGILKYSKSSRRRGRKSKKAYALNFGSASGNASKVIKYKSQKKNYDYKNNDINERSDINIFDIISKRYMLTGLKALFDE